MAFAQDREGVVTLATRIGARDDRTGAKGHAPLLAVILVVPAAELAAAGRDTPMEAVGVGECTGFGARLG